MSVCTDWFEAELRTSRGQGVDNLADIVANQTESGDFRVFLNDSSQGRLCVRGQGVCLVQYNDLEIRRIRIRPLGDRDLCEFLDFFPDHCDSSFVRGVQFEHPRPVDISSEHLFGKGQHCRGLACAWRAVKQEMRQGAVVQRGKQGLDYLFLVRQVFYALRATGYALLFLYPGQMVY